jgi:diguanylate cyclase
VAERLFIEHINERENQDSDDLITFQEALVKLVNNLSDSLEQTVSDTTGFSQALKDNLTELETHQIDDTVAPVISQLSENANAICNANEAFKGKLSAAQLEIVSLRKELENSRKEASTDALTGLYNRRALESTYRQILSTSLPEEDISLILMDIDHFKQFNDTHGHLLGDQILQFVGSFLKGQCDDPAIAFRFGGEEFAILCPVFNGQKALKLAEKLREKLATIPFNNKRTGTKIPPVTASFGVTERHQDDILMNMIDRADKALYAAKEAGRNKVHLS